jgi:hypothetical protein
MDPDWTDAIYGFGILHPKIVESLSRGASLIRR